MARTQQSRLMALGSPLGADVLLIKAFRGVEEIGRPFRYELECRSEDHEIKFDDIVGNNVTIRIETPKGGTRYFNGFVSRFSQGGRDTKLSTYFLTVVPWPWFLTRTADCRIFQEMKAPDIIMQVFRDLGFSDFEDELQGSYRTREYTVQYRETDFNFVSRMMEEEGIYYYFKHEDGKHTMVLSDSVSSHGKFPDYDKLGYRTHGAGGGHGEYIWSWEVEKQVQTGTYALNDFDFKKPKKALQTKSTVPRQHKVADYEVYDYPGVYTEYGDGESYAKVRIEELQSRHEVARAESDAHGVCPGYTFALEEHARGDQNREYLVVSAQYYCDIGEYDSGAGGGSEGSFNTQFTAIPTAEAFRPARLTPKPVIQGPQTAIVVGPKGEEIWTDEFGRVKCQFHWDRYGKADENSSCWIRVSHGWAGKNWGMIYLPRIGQEVIVEFLEGDPDRPIITGRVYNGDNMPPYALPDMQTISTLKSRSSKDAGNDDFNEIRFEDKKGEEQIYIQAQKNMDIRVENDRFETIEHDRHLVVDNDKFEHVKNERHETIDAHHHETIKKDRHLHVQGKEAKKVDKTMSTEVMKDVAEKFNKNHSMVVADDCYIKATNVVIEGTSNITLKVGGSSIAMDSSSINMKTTNMTQEANANWKSKGNATAKLESSGMTEVKGTMTKVNGSAMVQIQGGLVKIN